MKFFACAAILVGIFLIGAFITLFVQEKKDRKKYRLELISYLIAGLLTLTFGILMFFKFTSWWRMVCTALLVIVLLVFLIIITLSDKKGKKYIKYKTKGHGKNRRIIPEDDKFDEKK